MWSPSVTPRWARSSPAISRRSTTKVLALDPETMNIDDAGDKAEIARQVLVPLVEQLRGFGSGARMDRAEKERERKELFGEEDDE